MRRTMVRQAINCDICGAERVESTSFWFVAQEQGGEIRLRGWEAPRKSTRKAIKHLCGQKCVQRLMDNFTGALLASKSAAKDGVQSAIAAPAPEVAVPISVPTAAPAPAPTLVQTPAPPSAPIPAPVPSPAPLPVAAHAAATNHLDSLHILAHAQEEMSILERMGYDRETVALIEADSWAGPVRIKDEARVKDESRPKDEARPTEFRKDDFATPIENRPKPEREFTGARIRHFQRMA